MSQTEDAILFSTAMLFIVFGVVGIGFALQDDPAEPEIVEFNDNGLTDHFVFEEDDEWSVVSHEDNTVVIEGTVYRLGEVSLSAHNVERTEDGVVVEVGVEEDFSPVRLHGGLVGDEGQTSRTIVPPPIGGGFSFNATVDNVQTDEDLTVNYVEVENDGDEDNGDDENGGVSLE